MVVARTVKGYGVDFMENDLMWHYRSLRPDERERGARRAGASGGPRHEGRVLRASWRGSAPRTSASSALTGDLGIGLFDDFERVAPGRYLNVGIAEQNLVGVAAGLAYAGKVPFAYSIAPFLTSRPHDQVRVDVALARART